MKRLLALLLLASLAAAPAAAGETILVVGDSHTAGSFGGALDDALRAAPGNRVATFGVCSARPQSYFSETPHGCGRRFRDFSKKEPAKWLGSRVYKQVRPDGKGSACLWVGPPDMRKPSSGQVDAVYAALAKHGVTAGATLEEARADK